MKIAVVDRESDIQQIKSQLRTEKVLWLPVSPLPVPALERDKLSFTRIEKFFSPEEVFDAVAIESDRIVKKITKVTDIWVNNNYDFFSRNDLSLLKYMQYYLTILFDGILMRIYILEKILSSLKPEEIIIVKNNLNDCYCNISPWNHNDTLWAYCAEYVSKNLTANIKVNVIRDEKRLGDRKNNLNIHSALLYSFPYLYSFLRAVKRGGVKGGINFLKRSNLVAFDTAQWPYSTSNFEESGFNILTIILGPKTVRQSIDKDFVQLIGLSRHLKYSTFDLTELVKDKINLSIGYGLRYFPRYYKKAARIFRRTNIKGVLFAVTTNPRKWVFLQAARNLHYKIFAWGHGASGQGIFDKQHRNELLICDYYFTQGEGSQRNYLKNNSVYGTVCKPVGFPYLDVLKKDLKNFSTLDEKYDFVYVTNSYYHNDFYFFFSPGKFDSRYFDTQSKIIRYLAGKNIKALFKGHPSLIYKDFYNNSFGQLIQVESTKPLKSIIPSGKAFIIDEPSTTVLEVLCTQKPVFVLIDSIKLTQHALELLKRRAICASSVDKLIKQVDCYIVSGEYSANVKNTDYLKAYGTYQDDGKSALRGSKEVINCLSEGK